MANKKHIVVLSGAGISAESGIKTFRDTGGLWENHRVEDVATPQAWKANPQLVLEFYNQRRKDVQKAKPNAAHQGLAALEKQYQVTIITQNIDDLHERGGSTKVIHLHGQILQMRSQANDQLVYPIATNMHLGDLAEDKQQLRPNIVWFQEAVPLMETAAQIAMQADIFVCIGTSLQVYPAAGLLYYIPAQAPKYIIDKAIPEINNYQNLIKIQRPATLGVKQLLQLLT